MLRTITITLVLAVCVALPHDAQAQVDTTFTYQGFLEDNGQPIPDDTLNFVFRLWDAGTGGNQVGPDLPIPVEITDGLFTVPLYFGDDVFDGARRWLEIEVEGTILTPRQEMMSVPYSGYSLNTRGIHVDHANDWVGLGTANPTAAFHVNTTLPKPSIVTGGGADYATVAGQWMSFGHWDGTDYTTRFGCRSNGDMFLGVNGENIGIGTDNPTAKLHITGTAGVDGIRFPDGTLQTTAATGGSGSSPWNVSGDNIYVGNEEVGIGISNPGCPLHVWRSSYYDNTVAPGMASFVNLSADELTRPSLYLQNLETYGMRVVAPAGGLIDCNWAGLEIDLDRLDTDWGFSEGLYVTAAGAGGNSSVAGLWTEVWGGGRGNYGIFAEVPNGGQLNSNIAVYARAGGGDYSTLGLLVDGHAHMTDNLHVNGVLTKSAGSFKIDHPLDPENKYLSHSFVESPDMMNVYNGNITTDADGYAVVKLPEWFDALNRDFRYQLTVIGTFAQAIIAEEVVNNEFVIQTDQPDVKVSWQVTGIRQDPFANANRIPVEQDKSAAEVGSYLHPELYGKADEFSRERWLNITIDPEERERVRSRHLEKRENATRTHAPAERGQ